MLISVKIRVFAVILLLSAICFVFFLNILFLRTIFIFVVNLISVFCFLKSYFPCVSGLFHPNYSLVRLLSLCLFMSLHQLLFFFHSLILLHLFCTFLNKRTSLLILPPISCILGSISAPFLTQIQAVIQRKSNILVICTPLNKKGDVQAASSVLYLYILPLGGFMFCHNDT